MKKHLLFYVIFFSYLTIHASGWGNDVMVHQGQPQGVTSAAGKASGVTYAAVPDNSVNPNYSIVIYRSLNFGDTWSQFSEAGIGSVLVSKTKMITSGLDSVYLFYLMNNEVHSLNVESGTAGVWNTEPVRDFDVATASDGSLFLLIDVLATNQIRRFGSYDGGASWGGSAALITSNGAFPKIYKSQTSDTLLISYYGPVDVDTAISTIRSARYVHTSPGTFVPVTGSFMDLVINNGIQRKEFKTVYNGGVAWFFYTEGNTVQELKYRVSTDGGITYGSEVTLASDANINHHWFDATHSVLGFIGDGVSITWYQDSLQAGSPTLQSDKMVFSEASNALPYSFSTPTAISEHSPEFVSVNYTPALVSFPVGSFDERGVLWVGRDGANMNVYWDYLTAITSVNQANLNSKEINIFPNPVSEELNISFGNVNSETCIITIEDVKGRIIQSNEVKINNDKLKLNVADHKPGIYLLKIKTNNLVFTEKFVISR